MLKKNAKYEVCPPWIKITGQPSAWVGLVVVVTEKLWSTIIRIIRSKKVFEAIFSTDAADFLKQ